MATIKSYTDLQQSKKLAEILPLESADMYWYLATKDNPKARFNEGYNEYGDFELPCWSLAALISVLPRYELNNFGDTIQLGVKNEALATEGDETLLDLVVNMIIHLHELNLL